MESTSSEHTHVFPVDPSLTPDEAWKELCTAGVRTTYTGPVSWSTITCDGIECANIESLI